MRDSMCDNCGASLNFATLSDFAEIRKENGINPATVGSSVIVLTGDVQKGEELDLRHGRILSRGLGIYTYMTPDGEIYNAHHDFVVVLSD